MLNRISCILSVAALIGLASCSKVVDQVPIPSRGPANLYGQFLLLDEFQDDDAPKAISPDSLHVSVTKNGGEQTDATFDAASSTYTFANLAPGTYALSYAYDGGQYETIVNPSFEHFGGDTAVRLPKAFLYRRSTTQVDSVKGLQKDVSKTIVYTQSVLVQPGDTLFVHKDSLLVINPNSSTPVTLLLEKDSTFRPTTLTEYNIRVRFTSIDRQLQFSVFLNQLSRDSMQRGYVAYFSTSPDVSNTNYLAQQDSILNPGVKNIDVPGKLQDFIGKGFPPDHGTIYMALYGLSGKKYWYGTRYDATNPAIKIYPGLNLTPTAVARGSVNY